MPQQEALTSPFGNSPKDLAAPVPQNNPPAVPQGVPTPMAVPAQATPQAAAAPAAAPTDDFEDWLNKKRAGNAPKVKDPFEEKDPNLPLGYTPVSARLRRAPDGTLEHLRNDGKWAAFGSKENEIAESIMNGLAHFAIRTKEDIPRVIGAIAGAGIADRMGLGPLASSLMAGVGQAAGGAAQTVSAGKPVTPGNVAMDVGIGAAANIIPAGVGAYLEKKGAEAGAESLVAPLVRKGGEALADRQEQEIAAAQAIGAKPGPTQTAQDVAAVRRMGPEAQKLYQMQWGKAQQFKESMDNYVSRLQGGYESELGGEKPNFHKVLGDFISQAGAATARGKGLAKELSGGATYDIDPALSQMREEIQKQLPKGAVIFDDAGRINAKLMSEAKNKFPTLFTPGARELTGVYQELYNVARTGRGLNEVGAFAGSSADNQALKLVGGARPDAEVIEGASPPRINPGLTLDEMDAYRRAFGNRANFQSLARDETNDAYARLHHVMSDHLDGKMVEVLSSSGKEAEANHLLMQKQAYSGLKESMEDLMAKVENDPENAARALIDNKNPNQTRALFAALKPKQQQYLAGGLLNTILDPAIDPVSGKMKAATAEAAWRRLDGNTKELVFGQDGVKYIDSMINYAKAINLKAPGSYNPQQDAMMGNFVALAHSPSTAGAIKGAAKFISGLFTKNETAKDYVTDQLSDILMPTGKDEVSLAARQKFMNAASKAMTSRWARYGAQAGAAVIPSPESQAK